MLSALLKKLQGIRVENIPGRRRDVISVCASAYPDLLPWQIREACLPSSTKATREFEDIYYHYLTLLLHPTEGHQAARQDYELVQVSVVALSVLVSLCCWHLTLAWVVMFRNGVSSPSRRGATTATEVECRSIADKISLLLPRLPLACSTGEIYQPYSSFPWPEANVG